MNFQKNASKPQKSSLSVCGWLTFWRKKVFVNIYPTFTGLIKKNCLNKSKFSSGFARFQTW